MIDFSKIRFNQIVPASTTTLGMVAKRLNFFNPFRVSLPVTFGKISPKKIAFMIVGAAFVVVAAVLILSQFGRDSTFSQDVTAEVPIGKSFQFPVYDQNGKPTELGLVMNLTSAAKMKNILIQGKPATAREGKIFLILNLEVTNDSNQQLKIAPVDLIRLVDATGKKFAPDVHNEQVSVEPISVKKTRVGFVVDEPAEGFNLQVGEVDGAKETISLAI